MALGPGTAAWVHRGLRRRRQEGAVMPCWRVARGRCGSSMLTGGGGGGQAGRGGVRGVFTGARAAA
jgi:hypothetical protein